jgi:hypothetical protein
MILVSRKYVPRNYISRPWDYPGMNHGTACLTTEEQLCCYMAAYGDMHKGKLNRILSDFPLNKIDYNRFYRSIPVIKGAFIC